MFTTARNRLRNDINDLCSLISARTKMTSSLCNGEETDLGEADHSRAYMKILEWPYNSRCAFIVCPKESDVD